MTQQGSQNKSSSAAREPGDRVLDARIVRVTKNPSDHRDCGGCTSKLAYKRRNQSNETKACRSSDAKSPSAKWE